MVFLSSAGTHHKLKAIRICAPVVGDVFECYMIGVGEKHAYALLRIAAWNVDLTEWEQRKVNESGWREFKRVATFGCPAAWPPS